VVQQLNDFIELNKQRVEEAMEDYLKQMSITNRLSDSMNYSLIAGGKRLRPVLLIATYQSFEQSFHAKTLSSAAALEMIHTYSLIHDDLPAMDDDDLRRGVKTNHIRFDEATAILAGDALLTYSFEIIANDSLLTNEEKVELIRMLSEKSGPKGMVTGQILDMKAEETGCDLETLEQIHALKTGALLTFAVLAGAILAGATKKQLDALENFSYYLGLVFQIQDDILDVTGDEEKLGKRVGSDEENNKSTYPKLLGLSGAIAKKEHYVSLAKQSLKEADVNEASYLFALTDYLTERDH